MRKRCFEAGLIACLFLSSCSSNVITISSCSPIYAMNTTITVTFYNVKDYETYYKEIKKIYKAVDSLADDYEENSDTLNVYSLNRLREGTVSDTLYDLLLKADELYKDTDGYFNPYMGCLTHMWKDVLNTKVLPDESTVEDMLTKINSTYLVFDEDNYVKILGEGNIDLGGIAKGYATELSRKYLKENNVTSYMIDGGNSSIVLGDKAGKTFSSGLSKPYASGYIGIYKGKNIGISSSTPKYQYTEIDGVKYHHLLNPKTGYPSNTFDSVFVFMDSMDYGDAYSTAIFSMDKDMAVKFAEEKNIGILLYKDDEILYQSSEVSL